MNRDSMMRVDLTSGSLESLLLDEATKRACLGGSALGAKYLLEEVKPGTNWDDPENRVIIAGGPLGGTKIPGTGTFSVVTKGALNNLGTTTQANGFLGAYLRRNGLLGLIIQGRAADWTYLFINEGRAELRDARHLVGLDTWETEDRIKSEIGAAASVYCIGPAGENLVRFACLAGDKGHVAAHNGVGAVLGAKRLKAIAVARTGRQVEVADSGRLADLGLKMVKGAKEAKDGAMYKYGTGRLYEGYAQNGVLPVKNYSTNIWPNYHPFVASTFRKQFDYQHKPCWACGLAHCGWMRITEGKNAGFLGEEPEYEVMAAMSSVIGNDDSEAMLILANMTDRLGIDANESGWVIGWVMECYEKGLITKEETGGLDMHWGNTEATAELFRRIAHREGFGNFLADGVKAAAERKGGEALSMAVYTGKGHTPRGHDHRARWEELLDTTMSNTGTVEATGGSMNVEGMAAGALTEPFNPDKVAKWLGQVNGRRVFEDSTGICRFLYEKLSDVIEAINVAQGWELSIDEAMEIGRRAVNRLRVFNVIHGLKPEQEWPSERYGSAPVDGPTRNVGSIMPHFGTMRRIYWETMGWSPEEGRPLPETLTKLGLADLIPLLEGK